MKTITAILPLLALGLLTAAPAAPGAGAQADPPAAALSDLTAFASEYAPRVNFGARLEPERGVIHGAGQDPASYREYSALFDEEHFSAPRGEC